MLPAVSPVKQALCALRSLVFYAGYAVSVVGHSTLTLVAGSLMSYPRRYRLLMGWNRFAIWWLRLVCGIRYEAHGLETLTGRPCVVVSNHQSSWETIFLPALFPQLCTLLKRELLRIPFFGWGLSMMRPIAIDRDNPRAALRQMLEQGNERLQQGCSVLIFPEGTRKDHGEKLRFARGAAQLAIRAGVDLVCVAHDAGLCWPPRRFTKYPGTVRLAVSPPFSSSTAEAGELTRQAEAWILARLAEFDAARA